MIEMVLELREGVISTTQFLDEVVFTLARNGISSQEWDCLTLDYLKYHLKEAELRAALDVMTKERTKERRRRNG